MPKPLVMELFLVGQAKSSLEPLKVQGIYHLQDAHVNSYPHWHQQNGVNSIWFGKEYDYNYHYYSWKLPIKTQRRWFLGPRELLGGMNGYIVGPKSMDQPPTRIVKGWEYFDDNEWKVAADSEITFQDLSPSKLLDCLNNSITYHKDILLSVAANFGEMESNGGFRIFVHRPYIPATNPDSAIYIQNNAEAFVNVDYERDNDFEREPQTFPCWHTVDQQNLWFDLEVEIVYAKTYSREACVHEWQAKTLFRICKCLPYHYTQVFDWNWGRWDETLRCNHHGLRCFALVNSKFKCCLAIDICLWYDFNPL